MSKVSVDLAKCKSCELCIKECPKKAITMTDHMNKKGYTVVSVDDQKCIGCGICFYVCPDCVFGLEG